MGDAQVVWFYNPLYNLQYYYDDRLDQVVYANGARAGRPPNVPKEVFITARYQSTAAWDSKIPRTLPQNQAGTIAHHDAVPIGVGYVFATGRPPPTTPSTLVPASPSLHTHEQHSHNPGAFSNSPTQTSFPWEIANYMESMSMSGPGRTPSYHPPVFRTPQTQQNSIQAYNTPSSMLRSANQIPEPIPEAAQALYSSFKKKTKSRKFFVVGKVFVTLWAEPAGDVGSNYTAVTSGISTGLFGELVFSKIRRFVIVRAGANSCSALPIVTYGHQGVSKQGIKKSEHAIIFTGRHAPSPEPSEQPRRNEEGLLSPPIRVDPDELSEKLDPMSRVDFGKVYNIEHNVKVRSLGKVNAASIPHLLLQFRGVWEGSLEGPASRLQIQTPRGLLTDTAEVSDAPRQADLTGAYNTLLAGGHSPEQIRRVLRDGFQLPSAGHTETITNEDGQSEAVDDNDPSGDDEVGRENE